MITRRDAAKKIAEAIESVQREEYACSLWEKGGHCRIYVKDLGLKNAQDRGYVSISCRGEVCYDGLNFRNKGEFKDLVKSLNLEIQPEAESTPTNYSSNLLSGNEAWEAYHRDHPPGYRNDGWDSPLDRDDYEG